MKRLTAIFCVLFVVFGVVAPASAFRIRTRAGDTGAFRDLQVCTDGIRFDFGRYFVPRLISDDPDPGLGAVPDSPISEPLHITTDLALTLNPIGTGADPDLGATAETVFVGRPAMAPVSNTSPIASVILSASGTAVDPETALVWHSEYTEMWDRTLPAGTQLAVYILDGFGNDALEVITVTNCTLVDDPPPPPTNPCLDPEIVGHRTVIIGTEGNDKLKGTSGDDIICGLGGNDRIFSYGGNDLIYAGDGNDKVHAGSGDDTVFGEGGNDKLLGQWGNDTLDGGDGNDKLHGSGGDDVLIGGPGHDRLLGGQGHDTLTQ